MMGTPERREREAHRSSDRRHRHEAGFTLTEVVVALGVMVGVLVGTLTLFDRNNQLARSQTYVAEMQQALRTGQYEMIRTVRMAGRGGLPRGVLPQGLALSVRNNVPASGDRHHVAIGDTDSPGVIAGTDVLTVRGVLSSSVFQVNPLGGNLVLDNETSPTEGSVRVRNPHPTSGVVQDLKPLIDAVSSDAHAALLLVGPLDVWAVVEIDEPSSDVTSDPNDIRIGFKVGSAAGSDIDDQYIKLSGGFPLTLRSVAHVGLLEEYRYYIREAYAVAQDPTSDLTPRLGKVRFYPNTEIPHPSNPDLVADVADNIFDLQVALGVDTDGDGVVEEAADDPEGGGAPSLLTVEVGGEPPASKKDDDWLFNSADDLDGDGNPLEPLKWNPPSGQPPLAYVRLTAQARTDRRDFGYQAPVLTTVEDKDFNETPHDRFNSVGERRFRRRELQTVVDMRNL